MSRGEGVGLQEELGMLRVAPLRESHRLTEGNTALCAGRSHLGVAACCSGASGWVRTPEKGFKNTLKAGAQPGSTEEFDFIRDGVGGLIFVFLVMLVVVTHIYSEQVFRLNLLHAGISGSAVLGPQD